MAIIALHDITKHTAADTKYTTPSLTKPTWS